MRVLLIHFDRATRVSPRIVASGEITSTCSRCSKRSLTRSITSRITSPLAMLSAMKSHRDILFLGLVQVFVFEQGQLDFALVHRHRAIKDVVGIQHDLVAVIAVVVVDGFRYLVFQPFRAMGKIAKFCCLRVVMVGCKAGAPMISLTASPIRLARSDPRHNWPGKCKLDIFAIFIIRHPDNFQ